MTPQDRLKGESKRMGFDMVFPVSLFTSQQDLQRLLTEKVEAIVASRYEYLERMAAAYFLTTKIDPKNVRLVETSHLGRTTWHFEPMNQEPTDASKTSQDNSAETCDDHITKDPDFSCS